MNASALRTSAIIVLILAILSTITFITLYITQRKTISKVVPVPHAAQNPKPTACTRAKNLTLKAILNNDKPNRTISTGSLTKVPNGFITPVPAGVVTKTWSGGIATTPITSKAVNTNGVTVNVTSIGWKDIWLQGFTNTTNYPLLEAPEGLGYCTITSDGEQLLTSTPPLMFGYAQFLFDKDTQDYSVNTAMTNPLTAAKGAPNRILRKTDRNTGRPIAYCGQTDLTKFRNSVGSCTVNQQVFAVGSVGFRSIKLSTDETRLYVAYLTADAHSASETSNLMDFNQASGRVAVYTRDKDPSTGKGVGTNWQYEEALALQAPGGTNTQGIPLADLNDDSSFTEFQAYSRKVIHDGGSRFGSLISTSYDRVSGDRLVGIKADFGANKSSGPQIYIYHETKKLEHVLEGVLTLPRIYYKDFTESSHGFHIKSVADYMRLQSFGWDFDLQHDTCMVSYFTGDPVRSDQNVFLPNTVLIYKKVNGLWKYTGNIPTPITAYDPDRATNLLKNIGSFGTSIRLNCDATLLLVGSPALSMKFTTFPVTSQGGSVYLFQYTDGSWVLRNRIQDTGSNIQGAFGYWVNVDPTFRVATCSANTNTQVSLTSSNLQTVTCSHGNTSFCCSSASQDCEYLARIRVINLQADKSGVVTVANPSSTTETIKQTGTKYIDPYYGCNVQIAVYDSTDSESKKSITDTVNLFVPSIPEQNIHWYQLNTTN